MRLDLLFAIVAVFLLAIAAGWISMALQRRNRGRRGHDAFRHL